MLFSESFQSVLSFRCTPWPRRLLDANHYPANTVLALPRAGAKNRSPPIRGLGRSDSGFWGRRPLQPSRPPPTIWPAPTIPRHAASDSTNAPGSQGPLGNRISRSSASRRPVQYAARQDVKRSFEELRSQAELGNEMVGNAQLQGSRVRLVFRNHWSGPCTSRCSEPTPCQFHSR